MDILFNPVSGTSQPYTPPAVKAPTDSVPFPVPRRDIAAPHVIPDAASIDLPSAADNYREYRAALRQAAISFKDVYAVSDQSFTIFKDATGKYITRYVSLRDGKVTYLPEPTLVKPLPANVGAQPFRIAISV